MKAIKISLFTALSIMIFAVGLAHANANQKPNSKANGQDHAANNMAQGESATLISTDKKPNCPALLNHRFRRLNGEQVDTLCEAYGNKVVLVVNTASECGYTYQYEGLEHLYQTFGDKGFVIIGFPSNDFGQQEPGNEEKIKDFCRNMYSIKFPMYQKTHVAKGRAHPFIRGLAEQAKQYPRWNFHKYLLNRNGDLVGSWKSHTEPESKMIVEQIKRYL